jgi:hypothetical protein
MASPTSDSDTDPDMPEMVPVVPAPKCYLAAIDVLNTENFNPGMKDKDEEDKITALRILNRYEEAERNKRNLMWCSEDSEKEFCTWTAEAQEQVLRFASPSSHGTHTVRGGLACTTAASCARAGCENPARGTGGTSRYCSTACMCADESDEEDDASSHCMNTEAEKVQNTDTANQEKLSAMSFERLEANFQSALPLHSLIFLDVDGVLNTLNGESLDADDIITSDTPMMSLNRSCLQRLVRLVQNTQSHLVLSSTWRLSFDLKSDLCEALLSEGLKKDVFIGQTPVIDFSLRHFEIKEWLDQHLGKEAMETPWVVLDDMQLGNYLELKGHFVWVDPNIGFSDKNLDMAASILSTRMTS